jgi:hypothetical protein
MAQYYYVICFDDETKEWIHDIDSEYVRFNHGTVWNEDIGQWERTYDNQGNAIHNRQKIDEVLVDGLTFLNRISAVWDMARKKK